MFPSKLSILRYPPYGLQWMFPKTGKVLVTHQQLPDLLQGHEDQNLEAAALRLADIG